MKVVTCLCATVLGFALSASSASVDEEDLDFKVARTTSVLFNSSSVIGPSGFFPTGSGHANPAGTNSNVIVSIPLGAASPTVTQPITESPSSGSSNFTSVPTLNVTVTPSVTPSGTASPSPTAEPEKRACDSIPDGTLVCNGQNQYGFCNRGQVKSKDVSPDEACYTEGSGAGRIGQGPRSLLCNGLEDNTLVCNGPDQYGVCYGGVVSFQNVRPGNACLPQSNGAGPIVYLGDLAPSKASGG
ncbi:hypothetical protein KC345_g5487 [Hortaea werneckii]|nr:hypothetical protein KC345_g5487 [Hortaea werneckii]